MEITGSLFDKKGYWKYIAHNSTDDAIWITINLETYIRRVEIRAMQREICTIRSDRNISTQEWIKGSFSAPSWGTESVSQAKEHLAALSVGVVIAANLRKFTQNPIVFLSAIGWEAELDSEEIYEDSSPSIEIQTQLKMIKGFPDGHKYFQDQEGRLHIADNSGNTPLETEDGDLTVDFDREMSVSQEHPTKHLFLIPVQDPNGNSLVAPAYFQEARWLRDDRGMKVDKQARCLFNAFETPD